MGLDFSAPTKFQVRTDRLRSLEYERDILATNEHEVGHRDDGVTDMVVGCGDVMVSVAHEVRDDMGVKAKDVHSRVHDAGSDVTGLTKLEKALKSMADMEVRSKTNERTISKLEDEVVNLKSKMEMQAVNIVRGFECVMKVKDDEIRKLENENKELRQTISMLEGQLANQQVHTVTQAYWKNDFGDVGASHCQRGSGFDVTAVHNVTPIRVGVNLGVSGQNVTVHTVSDSSLTPQQSVIDAYVETLVIEQAHACVGDALSDKSYFFSSICMTKNTQTMESYVLKNFASSKDCRYIHFPICNQTHWTLVVYDVEDRSWKHFNPMRQRSSGRSDVYYSEVLPLKERVSIVMKRSLRADKIDDVSIIDTFNHPLEFVEDCPQQKPDS
ncbi:hypothetical protein LOK49_LG05G02657 [Camellia lanceoleosa]|uniref:Uncharacterized protein n=1 Tax=Camellia lanceoleosa TaxID=1840588 RepID=A0ACC0HJY0_9ERIC|nr:hypothetical protein LOK49_LG05G02657 [Camellia lanceoleosa]